MVEEFDGFDVLARKVTVTMTVEQAASLMTAAKLVDDVIDNPALAAAAKEIAAAIEVDRTAFQQESGISMMIEGATTVH